MYEKSLIILGKTHLAFGYKDDLIQLHKLYEEIGEKALEDPICKNIQIIDASKGTPNEPILLGQDNIKAFHNEMKFVIENYKLDPYKPQLTKKEKTQIVVPVRKKDEPKYSRNQICLCGSGKKYKHCCSLKQSNKT